MVFISGAFQGRRSIPEEYSKEMAKRDIAHEGLPTERALGLQWNVESLRGCFQLVIKNKVKPVTRREILSVTSLLYDPLGFVAPVVMPAKRIMQDLFKERHLDLHDEVPNDRLLCLSLPKLSSTRVSLCTMYMVLAHQLLRGDG